MKGEQTSQRVMASILTHGPQCLLVLSLRNFRIKAAGGTIYISIGAVFWKSYWDKAYEGRVKSVVWNCTSGYGARVMYSDLWEEQLGFCKLNSLLAQY